jgi:hypothetical protein
VSKDACEQGCLGTDLDGEPPRATYSYCSVIGQTGYLKGHSRPYIKLAHSQCACFSNNPKRSHDKALGHIRIYLKGTRKNGLILKQKEIDNLPIDCYVDANFVELWGFEDKQDPTSVKKRTGFIIFVADVPLFWQKKLQTYIAISMMEAECNALLMVMRDLLPLQNPRNEIMDKIGVEGSAVAKFRTTLWENDLGALRLAHLEPGRMTPHSKHYGVKYHWFRIKG